MGLVLNTNAVVAFAVRHAHAHQVLLYLEIIAQKIMHLLEHASIIALGLVMLSHV